MYCLNIFVYFVTLCLRFLYLRASEEGTSWCWHAAGSTRLRLEEFWEIAYSAWCLPTYADCGLGRLLLNLPCISHIYLILYHMFLSALLRFMSFKGLFPCRARISIFQIMNMKFSLHGSIQILASRDNFKGTETAKEQLIVISACSRNGEVNSVVCLGWKSRLCGSFPHDDSRVHGKQSHHTMGPLSMLGSFNSIVTGLPVDKIYNYARP